MTTTLLLSRFKPLALMITCLFVFSVLAEEKQTQYQEIEWIELMPKDDLDALLSPPEYLSNIEDGSLQDTVEAFSKNQLFDEQGKRFQKALTSTRVIHTFENKAIRVPGFIVPLESENHQKVTEFFIVPYFGACLHLPPPPPNQIIYATLPQGIEVTSLYEPFWFEGKLIIENTENTMGLASYRLMLANVSKYEEE